MTSKKAAQRYEIAYKRYLTGGFFLKLRDFCKEEGVYYPGFIEWAKENGYYFSKNSLRFDQEGVLFKVDLF
ncbi:MAG: hypothetical protein QMB39_08105 [Bacteroidales bacterium]|jgi:hypothetical protein